MQNHHETQDAPGPLHGRTLKALRGFLGMPAKELAERTGIPLATLQAIETGRRNLTPFQLSLIQNATGVDARSFVRGELREWDQHTLYGASSFNKWRSQGAMRQTKDWLQDLQALQEQQTAYCKTLKRNEARLYAAYVGACFAMLQSEDAFSEQLSGVRYWKVGG